jgi:uncharacterized glyoxalase superfamily protein PhnB
VGDAALTFENSDPLQLARFDAEVLEQPPPIAQQDRDQVDLELVEEPCGEGVAARCSPRGPARSCRRQRAWRLAQRPRGCSRQGVLTEAYASVMGDGPQIIPYLYYPSAAEALDFLTRAFSFEVVSEVRDKEGTVWTATVRFGDGLVMVGPGLDGFGTTAVPDGSLATTRMFVRVDDVEAHYAHAVASGAVIVSEVADHPGGHRQYVASDCGRQEWIFAQPIERADQGRG